MKKREAEFTAKFRVWLKYNWNEPAYFEVKCCRKTALSFSAVSEKQLVNLQIKKFIFKFSDYDRLGTPFDMVLFSGSGFVVIYFYKPRNKEFFIIPIKVFLKEKQESARRSLTEGRCREIGWCFELA